MERFDILEAGFYPVLLDNGKWEVVAWDGSGFFDTITGRNPTLDIGKHVVSVGQKIELPPAYKRCFVCGSVVEREYWNDMTNDDEGREVCLNCS